MLTIISVLAPASGALAQFPSPRILRLAPPGGARGSEFEITLHGDHLEGVSQLRFSHHSIRAEHRDGPVFRIVIQEDAPPGVHQCWTVGRFGTSYPVSFAVDQLREVMEKEPNNSIEGAQPLVLETVVSGVIDSNADQDHFKISLKAGQRFFAECVAERIDSRLDSTLTLLDPRGRRVAYNRDFHGEDAFLDATATLDGDHILLLHDFTHQGKADRYYRLRITSGPRVDFIVPAAVPAGETGEVKVYGRLLPGGTPAGQHWLGGALESVTVVIQAPVEPAPLLTRFGGDRLPQVAKVDLFALPPVAAGRVSVPAGFPGGVPVGFARGEVITEVEPNDDPRTAQLVSIPCDFTGQFETRYDQDWVEFEATKGEALWIEVIASRMGSPVDPVLTLTRADEKSSFLLEADDDTERLAKGRFDTSGVDPAFRWKVPGDGRYRIQVRDINASRSGLGLFYRLTIQREKPEFRVFLLSKRQDGPAGLTLMRGGLEHYEVHALRRGGYEGSIRVEASGLPIGVSSSGAVLGPGSVFAPLVFSAEPGAMLDAASIRVTASGWSYGERSELPGRAYVLDQTQSKDNSSPNLVRQVLELPLSVVEGPPPIVLFTEPRKIALQPGEKIQVKVKVERHSFDELVTITPVASVPGLKIKGGKIEKGKNETEIEFQLDKKVVPGRYSLALEGLMEVQYSKDPGGKKQKIKVRYPSAMLTLDVQAPPFEMRITDLRGGKLQTGGNLNVDVAIKRKYGFDGPLTLELILPEGVIDLHADVLRLPPGATAGTIAVNALEGNSPPGPRRKLILRATFELPGGPVSVDKTLELEVEPKDS